MRGSHVVRIARPDRAIKGTTAAVGHDYVAFPYQETASHAPGFSLLDKPNPVRHKICASNFFNLTQFELARS
jgi:hypothetical protein